MEDSMSKFRITALAAMLSIALNAAWAETPQAILQGYSAQAGGPAVPQRGRDLFTSTHGKEWSCSTCHGAVPVQPGKHAATGKAIAPLAPAFEPRRFSDAAKVEKWFGRNCNDVLGRPCSATEKADVLAWLISLKS
jgi:mono/diheme cytochrome c family protein